MAPVGSEESLAAAISAGADAVYFGIEGLNMRSRSSSNFTLDDMERIARQCSEAGVRTYLTVNTIIYDSDIEKMHSIVERAHTAGITAIIATDIATIQYCQKIGIPVHISTQANISNTEAVRFYAQWADVMVLARELNSSANRGACTQICRRSYTVRDKETGDELDIENQYIMSPKDLKTINFLPEMVKAGVSVFKIEGRARGPEYVYETVSCYSEALQAICDGTFSEERVKQWEERLAKVFNRGFWNGYYLGQRLGEWSAKYGSSSTRVKQYVAKAGKYYSKLGVGEFLMEAGELHVGDEVVITGPTTGALIFTVSELRFDLKPVDKVVKGQLFSLPVPAKTRPADRLYLWKKK